MFSSETKESSGTEGSQAHWGGGHIRGQVPGRRAPVGILGHCLDAVEGGKPWSLSPGKNKWAGTKQNPFMDEDFENIR